MLLVTWIGGTQRVRCLGDWYPSHMDNRLTELLTGLERMGIPCGPSQAAAIIAHLALVEEVNESFNLTTIGPEQAVATHLLDSAVAVPFLGRAPEGPFADLGSGAGFPGVPLTVLTGREVSLVESVKKKATFLERVVAELCLKATVHPVRAEELALERRSSYAAVTARALSALPSLVELASPLLRQGGLLICLKGRPDDEEIARGDTAAALCGMTRIAMSPVTVPGMAAERLVVVYERNGKAKLKLPRRNGMAQRQPLA